MAKTVNRFSIAVERGDGIGVSTATSTTDEMSLEFVKLFVEMLQHFNKEVKRTKHEWDKIFRKHEDAHNQYMSGLTKQNRNSHTTLHDSINWDRLLDHSVMELFGKNKNFMFTEYTADTDYDGPRIYEDDDFTMPISVFENFQLTEQEWDQKIVDLLDKADQYNNKNQQQRDSDEKNLLLRLMKKHPEVVEFEIAGVERSY